MRMRKKPNMPQRMARCSAVHITDPEAYRCDWLGRIPGFQSLNLEIGCGRGKFTTETAQSQPDALLVAVERVPEVLIIAMERAVREDIENVRFVETDAAKLQALFGPHELDRVYINFCDPWPGNRHAKRRLTHGNFLRVYRELLRPGGEVLFKTDEDDLFEFSLEQFRLNGFELLEVTRDLHRDGPVGVMTDYETKFVAQGVSINSCRARLQLWEPDEARNGRLQRDED